ncbi:MAG TPA: hypothetical protein VK891_11000 [Euzebyales bacterium]|nr:hypothetical protein [Euzebyales bacterium]
MRSFDKTTRRLAVLAGISVLAVGALALPALADNLTEAPSEGTEASSEVPDAGPGVHMRFEGAPEAFAEALAEELDLPVDRVTDAMTAARERLARQWEEERLAHLRERLDEAVAEGALTQEQADAIVAAMREGVLPLGPGFGRHGPGLRHRLEDGPLDGPPPLHAFPPVPRERDADGT